MSLHYKNFKEQVTTNMFGPVKYLNVLCQNRRTLGTLDMSGHFHQKRQCQLVESLMLVCKQKMNSIPNLFFEIL